MVRYEQGRRWEDWRDEVVGRKAGSALMTLFLLLGFLVQFRNKGS